MKNKIIILEFILPLILLGCSSPPESEVLPIISKRIESDIPRNCGNLKSFDLDKIGNEQIKDSQIWYPVRIKLNLDCIPIPKDGPNLVFDVSPTRLNEVGRDTIIYTEYEMKKNEYGEWEISLRN